MPSPMADLPAGTTFGTLVHAVLETTDPQAVDLAAELRLRSGEQLARRGASFTAEQLAQALLPVLNSPLGPLAPDVSLRAIPARDRLAEMDFEIPLVGGDRAGSGITLGELAPLIRRQLAPGDPLAGYADRLASPGFSWLPLRGYLTGSLDAVLRLPGPRYLVVDYKTNWLGDIDGPPLSAWHYRPDALDAVMAESDYPLQAMLYSVALHRFLRWRQPGYDPAVHIGGVLYLFVRGMLGPATPLVDGRPCGVFGWQPPVGLITGLSDLLDGDGGSGSAVGPGMEPALGADRPRRSVSVPGSGSVPRSGSKPGSGSKPRSGSKPGSGSVSGPAAKSEGAS
jgi:exodeoxyribonuclease V beta subunit